jgi:hypothetical protein
MSNDKQQLRVELVQGQTENLNSLTDLIHKFNVDAGWWSKIEKIWLFVFNKEEPLNETELSAARTLMVEWSKSLTEKDIRKLALMVISTKLSLVHSEVSESLEGIRKGLMDDHLPHRKMFDVEIADTFIRLFDVAGAANVDLGGSLAEKFSYNANRADHKKENREAAGGKLV